MRNILLGIAALIVISSNAHGQARIQNDVPLTRASVDATSAIQRLTVAPSADAQAVIQEILIVADTTVGAQYFLFSQPGQGGLAGIDRSAVRFTPSFGGQIIYVGYFMAGSESSPPDAGKIRISLAGTHNDNGWITPVEVVDSADVDFGDLRANDINFLMTLDDADWEVREDEDFFITFEVVAESDSSSVDFVVDAGSADQSDDRYFPARTVLYGDFSPPDDGWLYRFQNRNNQVVAVAVANLMPPELVSPAEASEGLDDEVTLTWNSARRSESYRVQVTSDMVFDDVEMEHVTSDTTYALDRLSPSVQYWWRVRAENDLGESPWSQERWFVVSTSSSTERPGAPDPPRVDVYPNPARDYAEVNVHLHKTGPVRIHAFDALGRKVGMIFDGVLAPGVHSFDWNTAPQPMGLFFLRVEGNGGSIVKSVVIP